MTQLFAFPTECPDDALLARWESLLGKAPRLSSWLDETLRGRRAELSQEFAGVEVERVLWTEMSRWLNDFEALPSFAVSAIATTIAEQREPLAIKLEKPIEITIDSPETALTELEALAADPAFALAHHCVEARIRPHLHPLLPESAWFGLLHASAQANPQLSAATAVGLVLRVSSRSWQAQPSEVRRAAMRLFQATAADLKTSESFRAGGQKSSENFAAAGQKSSENFGAAGQKSSDTFGRLCAVLSVDRTRLSELVAAGQRLRKASSEAATLCAGLVARLLKRPGGLSLLGQDGDAKASDAEVAELREHARRQTRMTGYGRLLRLI
ncbi:MAG TPA: hypothetical protein VGH20_11895 [Myxococcales bacterium]|jgi:hypothetical protein